MSLDMNKPVASNAQIVQQSSSGPSDKAKERAELEKELESRKRSLETRLSGAKRNLNQTMKSIAEYEQSWNYFRSFGNEKAVLDQQRASEYEYCARLQGEQKKLLKQEEQFKALLDQGKYEEAKALLNSGQKGIQEASAAIKDSYVKANETLSATDRRFGYVEKGLEVTRNTCVIAAATVATGGTAGALMAGYGVAAGGAMAVGVGTVAGTSIGAASNFARAGVDENYSATDAVAQTITDAKSAAVTSAATVTGVGVAGKIIGKAGGEAVSITTKLVAGSAAGGSGAAVSTAINTTEQYVKAQNEFNRLYGDKNIPDPEKAKLYENFMRERRLGGDQVAKDLLVNVGIGMVSGGQGSKFQAMRYATKETAKKVLITTGEALVSSANGLVSSALKGQLINEDGTVNVGDVIENGVSSGVSSYIGGVSTAQVHVAKGDKAAARQHLLEQFTTAPTFDLTGKRIPPPVIPKGQASKSGSVSPEKVDLPKEVTESSSYKAAKDKGEVSVSRDGNLPEGVEALAISREKDGVRNTEIKLSNEHADGVENKAPASLQKLEHEIGHANQKMIDPVHVDEAGSRVVMSEAEYTARRAFQELEARAHENKVLGDLENMKTFSELSDLILREGNYEKAIQVAKSKGLSDADVANYKGDYENNINPNRKELVQRSNAVTRPKLYTGKQVDFLERAIKEFGDASPKDLSDTVEFGLIEAKDMGVLPEYAERVRDCLAWRESHEHPVVLKLLDFYLAETPKPSSTPDAGKETSNALGSIPGVKTFTGKVEQTGAGPVISGKANVEAEPKKTRVDEPHNGNGKPAQLKAPPKAESKLSQAMQEKLLSQALNNFREDLTDVDNTGAPSLSMLALRKNVVKYFEDAAKIGIRQESLQRGIRETLYDVASNPNSSYETIKRGLELVAVHGSSKIQTKETYLKCLQERFNGEIQKNGKLSDVSTKLINELGLKDQYKAYLESPKPEPVAKPEPQAVAKPETEAVAKQELGPLAKAETKPEAKPEPKAATKQELEPLAKSETKLEQKAVAKPEQKAVAKPEPQAVAKPAEKKVYLTAAELKEIEVSPFEIAQELPISTGDMKVDGLLNNLRMRAVAKQPFEVVSKISGFDSPEAAKNALRSALKSSGIDEGVADLLDGGINKSTVYANKNDFEQAVLSVNGDEAKLILIEREMLQIKEEKTPEVRDRGFKELRDIAKASGLTKELAALYLKHKIGQSIPEEKPFKAVMPEHFSVGEVRHQIRPRELISALGRLGFKLDRQNGTSHAVFKHPDGRTATIPVHNEPIPLGTLRGILRDDLRITADQLSQHL